jgi:cation:H+ antiporter
MPALLSFLLVIVACYFLSLITKKIVFYLDRFSRAANLSDFAATTLIVSLATSLPELSVSVSSSLKGTPALGFGNAIGANMTNLSLVMGVTALIGRSIHFNHTTRPDKLFLPLIFTFFPFLFALDGQINRLEGLLLVILFLFFIKRSLTPRPSLLPLPIKKGFNWKSLHTLPPLLIWVSILMVVAQFVVKMSQFFADNLNLPISLVGIFIVSLGTTLPELFFNLKAVKLGHPSMATANVIGSCLFNANFIIGLSALINPITFQWPSSITLPAMEYFFVTSVFTYFIFTKKRLDSWEGIILLVLFFYYAVVELAF